MCKKSTSFDQCTPKIYFLYLNMLVIFGYKCLNYNIIIWTLTHKGHTPNFVCEEGGHYMLIFHIVCVKEGIVWANIMWRNFIFSHPITI
jgi:hypothetical protein